MSDIEMSRMKVKEFLKGCSDEAKEEIEFLIPIMGIEAVALFIDEVEAGTA